jgi:hypothetical protein
MLSRRRTLQALGSALLAGPFSVRKLQAMLQQMQTVSDEEIFLRLKKHAADELLAERPIGAVVEAVGRFFLGVPYVAHTLEGPGEECLVVNLREFDCTTFMENTLVLARCIKAKKQSFAEYRQELALVRYRHGVVDGYPSRLHYFTDWVWDNAAKKVLRDIGKAMGGKRSMKKINFMTTHTESYPQLRDQNFVKRISTVEKAMNRRGFVVVPKNRVVQILDQLQSGDIVGTVTTMEGIDVSHTGLAVREQGITRFLHAPLSGGKVVLTDGSLAEYIGKNGSVTGIVIARPLEP